MDQGKSSFWIWALIDSKNETLFRNAQALIQQQIGGPSFKIHMTLSGPCEDLSPTNLQKLEKLSHTFGKFSIETSDPQMKDEQYESIFCTVRQSSQIRLLTKKINKLLEIPPYQRKPHISLYYGLADLSAKMTAIKKMNKLPDTCEVVSIAIADVNESLCRWNVVSEIKLR